MKRTPATIFAGSLLLAGIGGPLECGTRHAPLSPRNESLSDRRLALRGIAPLVQDSKVSGRHYQGTAEHWLQNMDRNREEVVGLLPETYGASEATKWRAYGRTFFMGCAELWGYREREEWRVSHYLFEQKPGSDTGHLSWRLAIMHERANRNRPEPRSNFRPEPAASVPLRRADR